MPNNQSFRKWTTAYKKFITEGVERQWPSETLIRIIKGPYLSKYGLEYKGKRILDVGFGAGEAFFFLNSLQAELYGTEVEQPICDMVAKRLDHAGIRAELRVGTNTTLPYPDNYFDYVISWNVIHYESNEDDMLRAITEYARVLKSGGRFFLSTTGPDHKILKNADQIGVHQYRIGREDDHRKGQIFFYFDEPSEIKRMFSTKFDDILIGRTYNQLFNETLDWFIVTGVKF